MSTKYSWLVKLLAVSYVQAGTVYSQCGNNKISRHYNCIPILLPLNIHISTKLIYKNVLNRQITTSCSILKLGLSPLILTYELHACLKTILMLQWYCGTINSLRIDYKCVQKLSSELRLQVAHIECLIDPISNLFRRIIILIQKYKVPFEKLKLPGI